MGQKQEERAAGKSGPDEVEIVKRAAPGLCGTDLLAGHGEFVFHGEDVRHTARADVGKILVGLVIHDAHQSDIAVLHDNVDGRNGGLSVTKEHGIVIDGTIDSDAKLVVHRRNRKNFDVVNDRGDAFNAFYGGFRIGLQRRTHDLAEQRYFVSIDLEGEIVKNGIVRKQNQLMAYFLG